MTDEVSSETQDNQQVLDSTVEVIDDDVIADEDAEQEEEIGDEAAEIDPEPTEGLDAEPDDDDADIHPFQMSAGG